MSVYGQKVTSFSIFLQYTEERHNSLVMCWKEMTHFILGLSETNVLLIFMQL